MVFQHTKRTGLLSILFVTVTTFALCLLLALPVWAKDLAIPKLDNWVVDTTNTFSATQKSALVDRLEVFEKTNGSQIFVLMVPTTGQEDIAQYTRRVYDQWKVGRKNIDDGVLLVVAKNDRRLRIEVGYGLEGAITDLQAGRIIREFISPDFKKNEYVAGINQGVDKIMALAGGEDLPPLAKSSEIDTDGQSPSMLVMLFIIIFLLWLPTFAAALMVGILSFFIFSSLPISILVAVIAFIVFPWVRKAFGRNIVSNAGLASRRGSNKRRGGGGGFGGGGGGRSGGGGASGGW